jgi:putative transposase
MGEYMRTQHTPHHIDLPGSIYMITAGTHQKKMMFGSSRKLALLEDVIMDRCKAIGWKLAAWVILPNHYHILAQSPIERLSLDRLIRGIHSKSALLINRLDNSLGRKVWYNYFDTCVRSKDEYYARMKYILENPEKHGIVSDYREYRFSSYETSLAENESSLNATSAIKGTFQFETFDEF